MGTHIIERETKNLEETNVIRSLQKYSRKEMRQLLYVLFTLYSS